MRERNFAGIGMTSSRTRMRMIERLREQGIRDEVVLTAMQSIPRHIFVDEALASRAYEDTALPLGFGQTISSPYIVARMTELLRDGGELGRVLEIGTGCGYQTAVLARVAREVYSVERVGPLLMRARRNLREIRLPNVRVKHADGMVGLAEIAPFDGIIVAAAASHIPEALRAQLAPGGRLVLPVGTQEQHLCVVKREGDQFTETMLEAVRFVPLLGGLSS